MSVRALPILMNQEFWHEDIMIRIKLIRRAAIVFGFILATQSAYAAAAPTKVTIHVPSKSLSIMPYYLGKDKGFFAAEGIEPQLVMMAPPTAIAAMVAGELDFSSTTVAATSAIMRGLPLRRVFYEAGSGPRAAGAAGDQIG
jgi:ABC-type nitrate/sulfonate/bicarbonate transport system substrate-binding protein